MMETGYAWLKKNHPNLQIISSEMGAKNLDECLKRLMTLAEFEQILRTCKLRYKILRK